MTTTKEKIKQTPTTIPVLFRCFECEHSYRTELPPAIAVVALRAWATVHLGDTCKAKGVSS